MAGPRSPHAWRPREEKGCGVGGLAQQGLPRHLPSTASLHVLTGRWVDTALRDNGPHAAEAVGGRASQWKDPGEDAPCGGGVCVMRLAESRT